MAETKAGSWVAAVLFAVAAGTAVSLAVAGACSRDPLCSAA